MKKAYKATNLYYLKIVLLVLCIVVASLFFYYYLTAITSAIVTFFKLKYPVNIILQTVIAAIFGILGLFAIYVIILSNKPVIFLDKDALTYRYKKITFAEIKSFHQSSGGSEPFLMTKEGKRIDLELSWLKKDDREEIKHIILSHLSND